MNFKSKIYILAFAILSVIIAACNSTTTGPTTDNRTPLAVTNLKATSLDSATIKIKWDAPASQTDSMFAGYIVKRTGDDNSVHTDTINALKNPYTITGLKQGVIYTFNVLTLFKNGNASGASISWSPSYRFVNNINDQPIWIYETASKLGSGLQLYDIAGGNAPHTLSIANCADWNFALDTRNSAILIGSPTKITYNYTTGTPGITEISDKTFDEISLDDVYDSESLDKGTFNEMTIDLTTKTITNNLIIIVRVKESNNYNYAKILIKKTANGWLQTAPNGDKYLECVVSYQVKQNVPYAKRSF